MCIVSAHAASRFLPVLPPAAASRARRQPEYMGLLGASEHALKLEEADMRRLRANDARQKAEIARAQGMDVELQSGPVPKFSTTNADLVSARDKALRDLEDFKRALGGKVA